MRLSVLCFLGFLICGGQPNAPVALTIFSGNLPDLKNEYIALVPLDEYFPGLKLENKYPIIKTDSTGSFKFIFTSKQPGFYQIIFNNYHQLHRDIYLGIGDSIHIEQSSGNEEPKFLISGKGSEKLKHLEKDYTLFPKSKSFYRKISSNIFPTEHDFKKFIDSIHYERILILRSSPSIPQVIHDYHFHTILAERASILLEYLERRNYYTKGEFDYFIPEEPYYEFLDSIDFNSAFTETIAAKLMTNHFLLDQAKHGLKTDNEDDWWKQQLRWRFDYVTKLPKSSWTDLLALSTIRDFSFGLMMEDFFFQKDLFEQKMDTLLLSPYYHELFKKNTLPYTDLSPGRPAPDFELPDAEGVLHRLSDYKGKIIYMDFWGTWCSPCIQEIPDALALQEKYKDKPVVFLYIALEQGNNHIAGWKKFIAGESPLSEKLFDHKPFPGVHLLAENQMRNEAIGPYKINFAPTHVLVDQNGNIVKARAKGAKNISEDIDLLLKGMYDQ